MKQIFRHEGAEVERANIDVEGMEYIEDPGYGDYVIVWYQNLAVVTQVNHTYWLSGSKVYELENALTFPSARH